MYVTEYVMPLARITSVPDFPIDIDYCIHMREHADNVLIVMTNDDVYARWLDFPWNWL